ncbi:malate synthase G [Jeotgalibacillus haloalkalitolerans]|uniref:Malate synthase G n=1 Tax=Jeotgalibacillus haloalkalitolerans TaxID=3104292 RepID=A0ABU5KI59_9BACL|nr:malate synthase G [Jeotgalibacillus sp. HH7-29]MDZ5710913.1 malate synthase G [Jeotgalibacillus sp. HH7-29]
MNKHGLQVNPSLYEFIEKEALPETGINSEDFWSGFSEIVHGFTPKNRQLLHKREELQQKIDEWHQTYGWQEQREGYEKFLKEIGYLEDEVKDFQITTQNVDREIASQAGPQLVVPVNNARYAINAANARWGSLYDALYGTDVISEENGAEKGSSYNPKRGEQVITYAKRFLDQSVPLQQGSHVDVTRYFIENGQLSAETGDGKTGLQDPDSFRGHQGSADHPTAVLLQHHDLHIDIRINQSHPIGQTDKAGVKDVCVEAALTTIMDCEDSVTAVDAEDKVLVYRNWLGLMKGSLTERFVKGGETVHRTLADDRYYTARDGGDLKLRGRSLLLIRNVGHLMTNGMLLDREGNEVPEGIADAVITSLIAMHDIKGKHANSEKGSIYIVKPKMHGSQEVEFSNRLFNAVEDLLGLERHTVKIGVMDEERRTTLNLKNCIHAVKDRIVFINTGFLDRTGDEIHTSMHAGAVIRKGEMKQSAWLNAYEKSNVGNGLLCGLPGKAQIGKGMWAMPDRMKEMMEQKTGHLEAGGNTAWVPSPTAATLHALHYHQLQVKSIQESLRNQITNRRQALLTIPLADQQWSAEEIEQELENNAQGLLGYVVRWVEHGIGCSKVPDIHNVGLMEDRATLRISSQHMSNWLQHGIVTEQQILQVLEKMAQVVDQQNANDPAYQPMSENFEDSIAFQAAKELIFEGTKQPSGYTEPILHKRRLEYKEKMMALKES